MTTQALQDSILFQTGYLVNGIWKTLDTTFDVLNPATGEVVAKVAKAGKAETEEAIAAATKAFPAWRAKTAKERSAILYRWYELIIENKSWLGRLMTTEQGKPLKEAEGEVDYAASFIQWFAEQAKRANGEIIPPVKPGSRILATREPVGVVAAITPWNFPMAMLTRKLGPALAAGCTGVIKPANNTPLSAFALLTLAKQAGVPDGVLNAVAGSTSEISDAIMARHDVRKISFTGSTAVGKTLVRNSAETMKKVSMELGGNAPYIVTVTAGGAAKRVGLPGGFSNSARANAPYSRWQSVLLPVFLAAAVVFGVLSTLETKQNALLAWNLSVMLASANLLAFPMVCALPLKRIAARLAKSGSAVAGFSGADAIRRSNCVILTDGDLFPPGTVTLGGLKVFGEESGKVISYAATMAHASESGLSRLFDNLLASDGGFREQVEDVDFYEEGGVGGRIHGETVLFGTAGFMRKRGVNLPRNLGLKTGVFLSVDGTLIAVFAVKYMPAENVDWALHALHHSRITPVLAVRDGNITPALLKRKFGTDARAVYPKLSTRLALSERGGGRPYALLMREGLMPYAEVVLGSKRLCASAKRCTVLAFLAATASTLLAFYLTFVGAYSVLTPFSLLIYVLLWSLSTLVDALLSDRY